MVVVPFQPKTPVALLYVTPPPAERAVSQILLATVPERVARLLFVVARLAIVVAREPETEERSAIVEVRSVETPEITPESEEISTVAAAREPERVQI